MTLLWVSVPSQWPHITYTVICNRGFQHPSMGYCHTFLTKPAITCGRAADV